MTMLRPVRRIVLGAHRIVRAEQSQFERTPHGVVDASPRLDQSTQRSFCVRSPGVEKNAEAHSGNRVDALPD